MILNKSDVVFHEFHVQRLRHGRRLALAAERLVKSSCDEKERPRDGWSRTPAPRPLRDRSISAPTCDTSRRRPALDGAFLCFAVSAWACPVSCELPLTDTCTHRYMWYVRAWAEKAHGTSPMVLCQSSTNYGFMIYTNYGFIIYTNYGFIITRRRQDGSIYTSQDDKITQPKL